MKIVRRYLQPALLRELHRKILLVTGPRQCGKTTLARMLVEGAEYFNYDLAEHRLSLSKRAWNRDKPLVIFDELHKMAGWKAWLKGTYDVEGLPPGLLVTGSANLETFRKTGDSLAGRHFQFRLHPLDVNEAVANCDMGAKEALDRLLAVGGFPEPFLDATEPYYNRWRRSHVDIILKDDLRTLTAVQDIQGIETLIELLRSRVGSPTSAATLAGDLQKSPSTIQSWLRVLERLYVVFKVVPHHRNVARALLKQPKYYFYDAGLVTGDASAKLECVVACALLKEVHRRADVEGEELELRYIRDKEGREVDFLIADGRGPRHLIEVKWRDAEPSRNLRRFFADTPLRRTQVVGELANAHSYPSGEQIAPAAEFLARLDI